MAGKLLLVGHGSERTSRLPENVVEKQSAPFYFCPRVKAKERKKDSKFQGLGDQDDGGVICNNGDFEKS